MLAAVWQMHNEVLHLTVRHEESLPIVAEHHVQIAAAIGERSPEKAARAMSEHLERSIRTLSRVLGIECRPLE